MALDVSDLMKTLSESQLIAECPHCHVEFALSDSLLFDGRGDFPEQAEETKQEMLQEFEKKKLKLEKLWVKTRTASEIGAISSGIGKNIEKILPAHKNFGMTVSDCRFLADPIDMIVFHGISENRIDKITFMEIKTGKGSLKKNQKQIKMAIEDKNVLWRSF